MNFLSSFIKDILNLVYPCICEGCGVELLGNESVICISCWQAMPETKFHLQSNNPVEQKFLGRIPVQHASSLYYFNKDSRIQMILHALKYRQKTQIGILLGQKLGNEIKDCNWIKEIDRIIPIPLAKQKLKARGYNQSELIATGLSDCLHIPLDTTSLIRIKNTQSQTTMSIVERMKNMKEAFTVVDPFSIKHQHILLVDDVLTTGSTIESCAQEILKIADTKISILTLAYAIE